ncbi:hypothetical protein TA3x_004249 [Tundrisphaera sp. TA3]|uniref:hypothetical protein n=1 Tax=Tundrisphaera sp. TA3 TaxID=3435775 RepID=UPI003EBC3A42
MPKYNVQLKRVIIETAWTIVEADSKEEIKDKIYDFELDEYCDQDMDWEEIFCDDEITEIKEVDEIADELCGNDDDLDDYQRCFQCEDDDAEAVATCNACGEDVCKSCGWEHCSGCGNVVCQECLNDDKTCNCD